MVDVIANAILRILFCNDIVKTILDYYLPLIKCFESIESADYTRLTISFNKYLRYLELKLILSEIDKLLKLEFFLIGFTHFVTRAFKTEMVPHIDVLRNLLAQIDTVYSIYIFNPVYNTTYNTIEDDKLYTWVTNC